MSLNELLDRAAATWPGRVCLIDGEDRVTYSELRERAGKAAALLRGLGVGPGDTVAVWLRSCSAWIEIQFALAQIGAAAIAVNNRFALAEVDDFSERSDACALVLDSSDSGPDLAGRLKSLGHRFRAVVDCRADGTLDGAVGYASASTLDPDTTVDGTAASVCAVFSSSGTTSKPKLIAHKQEALARHGQAAGRAFGYGEPGSVVLGMLPVCGVFGFATMMASLASGATLVIVGRFDAGQVLDMIGRHRATRANGSDEMFRRLFRAARDRELRDLGPLAEGGFAAFGGDPGPLVAEGDALGVRLFGLYGSSEIQALAAKRDPAAPRAERVKAGGLPVAPTLRVRVRNIDTGALCEPGQAGELEFTGHSLSVGYLHDEARTAEDFTADGWFRSGDLGYAEPGGRFCFTGRRGDAFRLSGFLTSPREIETVVEGAPGAGTAQVVLISHDGRDTLVAFVIPSPGAVPDEAAVIAHCREKIAGYKVPRRVLFLDAFPVTNSPNGEKIQRERLRQLAADSYAAG
ncbi:MAG: AMP-binding protein [Streptosporangiales bacterium]|nr:AMP-binding protein [Streptosporangiales bacterium]